MKKIYIRGIIITVIVAVIFNLLAFVIPFTKTGAFWTAYIFGMAAIFLQPFAIYFSFSRGGDARSRFYGFPIARIALLYLCIQITFSLITMVFARFNVVWIAALISALLLSLALLGLIITDTTRNEIERQDEKLENSVRKIRSLYSLCMTLPARCADPELRKAVDGLAQQLRFSDPVSGESLADIENELESLTLELQRTIIDKDVDGAMKTCKQAETVLAERNRLCKLNKGRR